MGEFHLGTVFMIGMTFRMKFVLHSRDKINWLSLIMHSGLRGFWRQIRYAWALIPGQITQFSIFNPEQSSFSVYITPE